MTAFTSSLDPNSEDAAKNCRDHNALIDQFRGLEAKVRERSAMAEKKFRKRGQLLPRERVDLLLDRGAPFLKLSTLVGYQMHEDDGVDNVYGGGIICGIGYVSGVRCMIVANDAGIKGGAAHPMGLEKVIRAQKIALKQKLPYVQLVESAGANLFLQSELFVRGGATFAYLARLSAAGIPVVSVVHGSSTAGGAYQPGMSDYVIMVRNRAKVFLAGPPLLKAATGEIAEDEELGGAEMHYRVAGTAEYLAEDDADAIRLAREVLSKLSWNDRLPLERQRSFKPPRYDVEDILSIVPTDYRKPYDVREVIARIVDDSDFLNFKPEYGPHTVVGHGAIEGRAVGILGNNGPIDHNGAVKAAQFIQLCCQSGTPLIFLQNTTGYMVGKDAEAGGIVKHGSKMIQAVTNATVPKLTLQIGGSFGAGHYGMCGRSFWPDFVFAWPNNRISVMGGEQAGKVMTIVAEGGARARGIEPDRAKLDAIEQKIIATYDRESTALFATARLWDDGLIDPRDTRKVLAYCLSICQEAGVRSLNPNTFGVARM